MRELAFCLGNSRSALVWHARKMTMEELWEKLQSPIRTAETSAQYHAMKKREKDAVKDTSESDRGHQPLYDCFGL